jgi:S-adenosylmethionine:tRNA ribosyltransferase-isomerase
MSAFDYGLPESAIAQEPIEPRSAARMLIGPDLADGTGWSPGAQRVPAVGHATVADLPALLRPGDVVVVNDTRVLAARLHLTKVSGGRAEVLLLEPLAPPAADGTSEWAALVRPGRRLTPGTLLFERDSGATGRPAGPVVEVGEPLDRDTDGPGARRIRLLDPTVVTRVGSMPLPPYIRRTLRDPDRYQTVYSADSDLVDRSVAAPTAGLHFTADLLAACEAAGARIARVDLAIGLDTFRPVTVATAEDHTIHTERYTVPPATVAACAGARRVVAIGTTAVRALESAAATGVLAGRTDLYIHGYFGFRVVDVLVTNFHLPRSSLLLLVEAFCGPQWRDLYATALAEGYRFLSFGDAMVVARAGAKGAPVWRVPAGSVR